jgi:transketolase
MTIPGLKPTREGYVEGLLEAGRRNRRVVVVEGDVSRSIGSCAFREEFPERFFNLGISEQDMMGEAAGLALAGYIPFVATYGVFASGRAWDQIRTSICYMNLPVRIGGAHGGLSVGPDGATHQALEDVALMRVLPRMKVLVPADSNQTRAAVLASLETVGPVYIRFGRNPVPQLYPADSEVRFGCGHLLREGSDALIVACGAMVAPSMEAAESLSSTGISAGVLDMVSIKPLDGALLLEQTREVSCVVTAEDHQAAGGLFGAVAECLARHRPLPVSPVAVQDRFGTSGSPREVMDVFGLNSGAIAGEVRRLLGTG